MSELIEEQKKAHGTEPSPIVEVHHIIPRSYFKKYNYQVNNESENLVALEPKYHLIIHWYAYMCAKPIMKRSLTYAFNMMYNRMHAIDDEQDLVAAGFQYEQYKLDRKKLYIKGKENPKMKEFWAKNRDKMMQALTGVKKTLPEDYKLLQKEYIQIINNLLIIDPNVPNSDITQFIKFCNKNASGNLARYNFQNNLKDKAKKLYYCVELDSVFYRNELEEVFGVTERTIRDSIRLKKDVFGFHFEDYGFDHSNILSVFMEIYNIAKNRGLKATMDSLEHELEEMYKINSTN